MSRDEEFMRVALMLAREAKEAGEVPIGAVVVYNGEIIASAKNRREGNRCATAHAELLAIEQACAVRGGWRLFGCELYVTLEALRNVRGGDKRTARPRDIRHARFAVRRARQPC